LFIIYGEKNKTQPLKKPNAASENNYFIKILLKINNMNNFQFVFSVLVAFLIGVVSTLVVGYYFLKSKLTEAKKQVESVDKEQIKNMLSAMGKKPSEEQVARIVAATENMKTKSPKEKKKKSSKSKKKIK